ncbi:clathrin light chain 2 [Cynara cardunculus var. scolymus]|uniref:Clathrin light chain n=1 Tax=Cynara cardunculus var. scolymus TaxID=59895 RepID=A0A103YIX9_CYNCS|nr:clathrin light chain 2 [Cynara cardunculus var. scolymus]KVI09923.1 hypothetical protein Ccrd_011689 [Cynara cardunculus var. scolymus]
MSSSFDASLAAPVNPAGDDSVVQDSSILGTEEAQVSDYDGSVLPPLSEMQPEEGFALREWRRQNALRLEEKERIEKELLNQILDEADEYKVNFHSKRKITCDSNIATNRESEKVYLAGRDRFHAEANQSYWKAIADLVPKEVAVIETRGAKKDQDKKPSVVMIQGPKPGKPTDLSRMRQILIKLKHDTPLHLKHSPPPPAAKDAPSAAPDAAVTTAEAVAVA